jgi:hypothetical protein
MPDSKHDVALNQADRPVTGLGTDGKRTLEIKREAVPLVFVPGIMGSNLRRPLRNAESNEKDMIWPVSDNIEMWKMYSGRSPADRKRLLVGAGGFMSGYLEVADTEPSPGDGFAGIRNTYHPFLHALRDHPWEELGKVFEFPVYAVGYDWTDDAKVAGAKLKARITKIIEECKDLAGACEKVILITHSMGGIVARSAMMLSGAKDQVLGVVHGVQPVTGSPAAYWRMKGGFEGSWWGAHWLLAVNRVLGPSGQHVTAVLANIPGGLQLLPNKQYPPGWLRITGMTAMPQSDPYKEIYKVKAVVQPQSDAEPSNNAYWGLIDPELLNFEGPSEPRPAKVDPNSRNSMSRARPRLDTWRQYLANLEVAETFHDELGLKAHDETYWFNGVGHATAVTVEMHTERRMVRWDPYRVPGFRGWFVDAEGYDRQAVLQLPSDQRGDATVPRSSARALKENPSPPGCRQFAMEHEPAYGNEDGADPNALRFTVAAITALAKKRLKVLGKIK